MRFTRNKVFSRIAHSSYNAGTFSVHYKISFLLAASIPLIYAFALFGILRPATIFGGLRDAVPRAIGR